MGLYLAINLSSFFTRALLNPKPGQVLESRYIRIRISYSSDSIAAKEMAGTETGRNPACII